MHDPLMTHHDETVEFNEARHEKAMLREIIDGTRFLGLTHSGY